MALKTISLTPILLAGATAVAIMSAPVSFANPPAGCVNPDGTACVVGPDGATGAIPGGPAGTAGPDGATGAIPGGPSGTAGPGGASGCVPFVGCGTFG